MASCSLPKKRGVPKSCELKLTKKEGVKKYLNAYVCVRKEHIIGIYRCRATINYFSEPQVDSRCLTVIISVNIRQAHLQTLDQSVGFMVVN